MYNIGLPGLLLIAVVCWSVRARKISSLMRSWARHHQLKKAISEGETTSKMATRIPRAWAMTQLLSTETKTDKDRVKISCLIWGGQ